MVEENGDIRKRRDPHAERDERKTRADSSMTPATTRSVRRNPHGERETRRGRTSEKARPGRIRKDPREQRQVRATRDVGHERAANTPQVVKRIDSPERMIGVVPDFPGGRPCAHDRDAFAVGRELAGDHGAVVAIVFGECSVPLNPLGADRVVSCVSDHDGYQPEWKTATVTALCEQLGLDHLVIPDSELEGADLGRRVAARLGVRPATHAWKVDSTAVVRRSKGGACDTVLDTPQVVLVAAQAAELGEDLNHEARLLPYVAVTETAVLVDSGQINVDPAEIPLDEAAFIVSGGNGVTDWPRLRRLAQALGASLGGSRVACDEGHVERRRQVGASGTVVGAACYMALGISGAQQHLQGIKECEHVISINPDPDCPMHRRADLAVVGDAQSIVAALLARFSVEQGGAD
jgi:electron transfer flavoprotein alpha subunit